MDMKPATLSFMQYQFCTICRLNHKQGSKHVYSKTHRDKLGTLLDRFRAKTAPIVRDESPIVEDEYWENGKNFWCYFCGDEAPKHMRLGDAAVKDGGIMEHFASTEHKEKTDIFWMLNKIEAEKKTQFIVSEDDFNSFKTKAVVAVNSYEEREQRARFMEWKRLQRLEHHSVGISKMSKEEEIQRCQETRPGPTSSSNHTKLSGYKRTISAHGPGLTSVTIKKSEEDSGNVHTGATPPWLQDDVKPSTSGEIGPSMKDYEKHLARVAKNKLPADRVGADFNRDAPTAANWLPSFGQVWNHGRRSNTKQTFLRREKKSSSNAKIPPPKRMKFEDMTS